MSEKLLYHWRKRIKLKTQRINLINPLFPPHSLACDCAFACVRVRQALAILRLYVTEENEKENG